MNTFIIGITGGVGSRLARELRARGDTVRGLVRREDQRTVLAAEGVTAYVGNLADMTSHELAAAFGNTDTVVYTAGSNGGDPAVTTAIDGDGVATAIKAAGLAGIEPFALVSVFPESWRERELGEDVEHYFAVKKAADTALSHSTLNWLILRPSLLVDGPGVGTISLGPAEHHHQITREDVAATLAALLHEPRITRQILELDTGSVRIDEAVCANIAPDRRTTHPRQEPTT